jgi:ferrochelatase
VLPKLSAAGASGVVVCPAGFVADHLEVLYDLDIEAAEAARALGLPFARTAAPNADPALAATLADVVSPLLSPQVARR